MIWKNEVTIANLVFQQKKSHEKNIINKYLVICKKISSKLEGSVLHYCPSLLYGSPEVPSVWYKIFLISCKNVDVSFKIFLIWWKKKFVWCKIFSSACSSFWIWCNFFNQKFGVKYFMIEFGVLFSSFVVTFIDKHSV